MAGKSMIRGSRAVAYALEALSKNTLADMLLDIIYGDIGQDATDKAVLARLQRTLNVVAPLRGAKPVNLQGQADRIRARALPKEN